MSELLPSLVNDAIGSVEFVGDTKVWSGLVESGAAVNAALTGLPFSFPETGDEVASDPNGSPDSVRTGDEGHEFAQFLNDAVFTQQNYQGGGLYCLGPNICRDGNGGIDPQCAQAVEAARLCIRVEIAEDGLDFTLVPGAISAWPISPN